MTLSRRGFTKLCVSALSLFGAPARLFSRTDSVARRYGRVRLVDAFGRPLASADLAEGENYIFHYPYVTTPCFLINLGRPAPGGAELRTEDGGRYRWEGGSGPGRSVVAYSAICAHMMTYPAHAVSFINYRHQAVGFLDQDQRRERRARVIYCCSEKSVYDAAAGARVMGGPARQPLAVILLEYDIDGDSYYATGAVGGVLFERFFEEFGFQLALEYRISDIRQSVTRSTQVIPLAEYCRNQVLC
jgi:Rieske Fe-S protein